MERKIKNQYFVAIAAKTGRMGMINETSNSSSLAPVRSEVRTVPSLLSGSDVRMRSAVWYRTH